MGQSLLVNTLYADRFSVVSFTAAGSQAFQWDFMPKEQRGGLSVQFRSDSGFHANVQCDNGVGAWIDITSLLCGVATVSGNGHFFAAHFFPWKVNINATQVGSNLVVAVGA